MKIRWLYYIVVMLSLPLVSVCQENCSNLIDDDGDGLIDFLDPDCHCEQGLNINLIPNPGFEYISGCCESVSPNSNCLENWLVLRSTPDLDAPGCMTNAEIDFFESSSGISLTSNILSIGNIGPEGESFGTCLINPTIPTINYNLSLDFALFEMPFPPEQEFGIISIVGFYDCQDLTNYIYNTPLCPPPPNSEILVTIDVENLSPQEWHELCFSFSTSNSIAAIVIQASCQAEIQVAHYTHYDNLQIRQDSDWDYKDNIVVNGNPCDFVFYLEVEDQDSLTYQWYYNGEPIIGQTDYQLQLNGSSSFIDGLYQVSIQGSLDCALVLDYLLQVPVTYSSDSFYICPGDSIFVGIKFWDEPGSYTIKYLDTFDPCQIQLEFFIELYEDYEFLTIDTICVDGDYEFQGDFYSATGTFTVPFSTVDGCDSNYVLELYKYPDLTDTLDVTICEGTSYEFNGSLYDSDGTYTSYYTNSAGCPGSATLFLSVAANLVGDTLVVVIEEGESYPWGGVEYTNEGIYTDTLPSSQNCDSVAILQLVTQVPCSDFVPTVETGFGCDPGSGYIEVELMTDQGVSYSIDGGATTQESGVFDNLTSGDYLIIVTTEACVINLGTISLMASPMLTGELASVTISQGDSIRLTPSNINFSVENYFWNGSSSIDCDTCSSITISPQETSSYSLTLTDENGCEIVLNTTVFVEINSDIYIPNIFSPNGDGINDNFRIFAEADDTRSVLKMAVYDRWGNELYRAESYNIGEDVHWDGLNQGRPVGTGVYTYMFLLSDGEVLSGTVTIIR